MWLLETSIRQILERVQQNGTGPNAEQQAQFEARFDDFENGPSSSRILTIADDKAEIAIKGVITKAPSFLAMLFGGGNVTYAEIVAALAEADKNPIVKEAVLAIDSPGGSFEGLFDVLAAIEIFSKPLKTVASNTIASGAYAIGAATDRIEAVNRAVRVGSIGVVATIEIDENAVEISSTDAPKKRPDVTTQQGVDIVREELDAMHDLFVESIAAGRNTTVEKVNARFGQGATLLAEAALERGMIDAIAGAPLKVVKTAKTSTASGGIIPETGTMDLQTLKTQHPDIYAAAQLEAITAERDRASAHLTMGEASGDMQTAIAAVKDGSEMTATLQATYMTAGMARRDTENRNADEDAAAAAADGASSDDDAGSTDDAVVDLVAQKLGYAGE